MDLNRRQQKKSGGKGSNGMEQGSRNGGRRNGGRGRVRGRGRGRGRIRWEEKETDPLGANHFIFDRLQGAWGVVAWAPGSSLRAEALHFRRASGCLGVLWGRCRAAWVGS